MRVKVQISFKDIIVACLLYIMSESLPKPFFFFALVCFSLVAFLPLLPSLARFAMEGLRRRQDGERRAGQKGSFYKQLISNTVQKRQQTEK